MKKLLLLSLLLTFSLHSQVVQKNLVITPIVDGDPPYSYVQDFRVTYVDSGRCTDESFIELILDSGYVALKPINFRISCEIVSWGRANQSGIEMLKTQKLRYVRILNPQTDHVYYYKINDPEAIQKILKQHR